MSASTNRRYLRPALLIFCIARASTAYKCPVDDIRRFPDCMIDTTSKSIWCDFTTFEFLPSPGNMAMGYDHDEMISLFANDSCIEKISKSDLESFTSLQRFCIDKNHIECIPSDTFSKNKELRFIDLSKNYITVIEKDGLKGLLKLEILHMDHNLLSYIDENTLQDLADLRLLSIRGNKLHTIHEKAFTKLKNLEILYLDGNNLNWLNLKLFDGLTKLIVLSITHNRIKRYSSETQIAPTLFRNSSSYRSHRGGTTFTLSEDVFQNTPNLRAVYLRNSGIDHITSTAFSSLCHLQVLDLRNNNLTELNVEWLKNPFGPSLDLKIEGNKWRCDCKAIAFQKFLGAFGQNRPSDLEIQCTSPSYAKRRNLDRNLIKEIRFREKCDMITYRNVQGVRNDCGNAIGDDVRPPLPSSQREYIPPGSVKVFNSNDQMSTHNPTFSAKALPQVNSNRNFENDGSFSERLMPQLHTHCVSFVIFLGLIVK